MNCFVDGCTETPVARFSWPWGEEGLVCAKHQIILSQKEKQLSRRVVITPLQEGAPRPITREERIASKARILALEEELDEARSRGMDLYRAHEGTKEQARLAKLELAAVDAELKSVVEERDELREALGEARTAAGRENDELQQLRALATGRGWGDVQPR